MTQPILQYETDRDKLRRLLIVFKAHWYCPECHTKAAFWLEGCGNPLHKLHEALWELDQEQPQP